MGKGGREGEEVGLYGLYAVIGMGSGKGEEERGE